MSLPLIVNQRKAAALLGVSEATIWRWRQSGQLTPLSNFKSPKFAVADLMKLSGKPLELAA